MSTFTKGLVGAAAAVLVVGGGVLISRGLRGLRKHAEPMIETPKQRLERARDLAAKAFDAYVKAAADMRCTNWEELRDAYNLAAAEREAAFQAWLSDIRVAA